MGSGTRALASCERRSGSLQLQHGLDLRVETRMRERTRSGVHGRSVRSPWSRTWYPAPVSVSIRPVAQRRRRPLHTHAVTPQRHPGPKKRTPDEAPNDEQHTHHAVCCGDNLLPRRWSITGAERARRVRSSTRRVLMASAATTRDGGSCDATAPGGRSRRSRPRTRGRAVGGAAPDAGHSTEREAERGHRVVRRRANDADAPDAAGAPTRNYLLTPLLPTMNWKQRGRYFSDERGSRAHGLRRNAGPTAWWKGPVVGGWRQSDHGVQLQRLRA